MSWHCHCREAACVHRQVLYRNLFCGHTIFKELLCSQQVSIQDISYGKRYFFCYRAGLYVCGNQRWNMHNLAPNAIVRACKNRCRKVEMCLGRKKRFSAYNFSRAIFLKNSQPAKIQSRPKSQAFLEAY